MDYREERLNDPKKNKDFLAEDHHSPLLDKLEKKEIFSFPESYFDVQAKVIDEKITINEELTQISPFLADLEKDPVYHTSTSFFPTFLEEIMDKLDEVEAGRANSVKRVVERISPLYQKYSALMAACIGILISIGLLIYSTHAGKNQSLDNTPFSLNQVDEWDHEALFAAVYWEDYDLELISQVLEEVDWNDHPLLIDELVDDHSLEEALEFIDWSTIDWYDLEE